MRKHIRNFKRYTRTIVNALLLLAILLTSTIFPAQASVDQDSNGGSISLQNDGDSVVLNSDPFQYRVTFNKDSKDTGNNSVSILRYQNIGGRTIQKDDTTFAFCGWKTFLAGRSISKKMGWRYMVDCQENDNGLRIEVYDEETIVVYSRAYTLPKK